MVEPLERFASWLDSLTGSGISSRNGGDDDSQDRGGTARVLAVLLVEIARSDHAIDESETAAIANALAATTSLSAAEIDELIAAALSEADSTVSLHEHVRAINSRLDKAAKIALIEAMWRVAIADGRIAHHEEYTVRKLSDLLHVKHRDFMQAKLRVLEASG